MPARLAPSIHVRAERPDDAAFAKRIFEDARGAEFAGLAPELAEQLLDLQFRAQARQYAASHPDATVDILEVDGEPVGRAVVARDDSRIRLVDLAVLSAHRRRGLASVYLSALTGEADARLAAVTLEVWSTNDAARSLYERFGFVSSTDNAGYVSMTRPAASATLSPAVTR